MTGTLSTNGGLHHEADDASPLPQTFGAHELAAALVEERNATRAAYGALAQSVQSLHAAHKASDEINARKHEATLKAVAGLADSLMVLDSTTKAIMRHVEHLPTKAELGDLGAQVGRQALDSITTEARQDEAIAKAQRLAMVRKGAFAFGVAAGTALALEWRAALKLIVSLFGG